MRPELIVILQNLALALVGMYLMVFLYYFFIKSYELTPEGIEIKIFFINIGFIRYDEILSVNLSSMRYNDIEKTSIVGQNEIPILRIRIVLNKNADPILCMFSGQTKKLRIAIYRINPKKFYFDLQKQIESYQKNNNIANSTQHS
jgi:hypothetical protein